MSRSKAKKFDCIAFKRSAQAKVYEETKRLSPQEEIAYFRDRAKSGALSKWWATIRARSGSTTLRRAVSR
jgi:hypothetical protein